MACKNCTSNGCQCVIIGDGDVVTVSGAGDSLSPYIVEVDICEAIDDLPTGAFVSGATPVVIKAGGRCAVGTITIPEEFDLCESLNGLPLGSFVSEETLVVSINSEGECEVVTINASGGGGGDLSCTDNGIIICGQSNTIDTSNRCSILVGGTNNITESLDSSILASQNCNILNGNFSDSIGSNSILGSYASSITGGALNSIIGGSLCDISSPQPDLNPTTGNVILASSGGVIIGDDSGITQSGLNLLGSVTTVTMVGCFSTAILASANGDYTSYTNLQSCFIAADGKMPDGADHGVSFGGSNEYETDSTLLGFRGVDPVQAPYLDPSSGTTTEIINALIDVGILARAQGS